MDINQQLVERTNNMALILGIAMGGISELINSEGMPEPHKDRLTELFNLISNGVKGMYDNEHQQQLSGTTNFDKTNQALD